MHEFYAQENFANSMREPRSGVSSEILTVARHVDFRLIQMSKKEVLDARFLICVLGPHSPTVHSLAALKSGSGLLLLLFC